MGDVSHVRRRTWSRDDQEDQEEREQEEEDEDWAVCVGCSESEVHGSSKAEGLESRAMWRQAALL